MPFLSLYSFYIQRCVNAKIFPCVLFCGVICLFVVYLVTLSIGSEV
jgi:hypothetical protein